MGWIADRSVPRTLAVGNSKPISTAHCKHEVSSRPWRRIESPGRLGGGREASRGSEAHMAGRTHDAGTGPNVQNFARSPFRGPGCKVEPATHEVLQNDMFEMLAVLLIRVVGIQVSYGLGCQRWPGLIRMRKAWAGRGCGSPLTSVFVRVVRPPILDAVVGHAARDGLPIAASLVSRGQQARPPASGRCETGGMDENNVLVSALRARLSVAGPS